MAPLRIILLLALGMTKQAASESGDIKKLALASNEFAFKLHRAFGQEGNAFTSPASVFTALSMLYEGARGVTAREIHQVLSFGAAGLNNQTVSQNFRELLSLLDNSSGDYKLAVANAILSQIPVLDSYKDTLKSNYRASVREVDFENDNSRVLEEVNSWVRDKTQGKIQKLLESISADTVVMLLNAVYFKGAWNTQFPPDATVEGTFYNDGINRVSVQMMGIKEEFLYGEFSEYGVQAVKLPYRGEHVSMLLLLPAERNGLSRVEQSLTAAALDDIISRLNEEEVDVSIPKFKLEDEKDLKQVLSSLGMRSAFLDGANFGGITRERNLKVSKVVHKAVIEVNEEGSEAAGASSVEITLYSLAVVVRELRADHPFLFFIRDDRTGMILFYGRVNQL